MSNKKSYELIEPDRLYINDSETIAYHHLKGKSPTVIFLGGLMSDMTGTKALAIEKHCDALGRSFIRFDYSGHGQSSGEFTDGNISKWQKDTLFIIDKIVTGPVVLVGSSMGGWQMLLASVNRPERVRGLVGIAAAPDFTEELIWMNFPQDIKEKIITDGQIIVPSNYGDEGYPITYDLIEDGRKQLLLKNKISFSGPVRLLHGMNDNDVPWQTALRITECLQSNDVVTSLIKNGDHRLSSERDLERLMSIIDEICYIIEDSK